ncbi:hypothetical protein C6A77_13675 [Pseudomonas sp. AFG_SD02_1510_Pfu_092]|uniref:hypothetical protein n=1 Tax=Pseudomonas sp. AFG_SD02_1510_Pfu_092 TaxID=2259497 RepID=UPI000DEFF1D2|nr:hypothetical protein [Pseudomonas sp. AFG_SD02_1510_Pfu_092]RCL25646.1 hypothetical protein C6A77_13675 [Pseudomonas sp. AFG_SD02_1510_Pfu_092]
MVSTENSDGKAGVPIAYTMVWYSLLNDCWKRYSENNEYLPGETLLLDRQSGPSERKVSSVVFGHPQMTWSDTVVTQRKRLLSQREVVLVLDSGNSAAWLSEIRDVAYDASQVLTIKASMLDSSIAYRGDGSVQLVWTAMPEFSFTGQDTLLLKMKRGYEAKKGIELYTVGPPANHLLRELNVVYQPANKETGMDIAYFTPGVVVAGVPLADARTDAGVADIVIFVLAVWAAPEVLLGKAPYDEEWLPSLVFPPPQLKRQDGSFVKELGVYTTEYFSPRQASAPAVSAQLRQASLSLDPLVRLIANGIGKQAVVLHPGPDAAVWVLEGEQAGALKREGGAWYYEPPAILEPAVTLEANNKTNRPAAVLSSVPKRFTVDVVHATQGGENAYATFASYYAPQTHYFRASLESGKLRFTFWYYDADKGQDVQVEERDTEWVIASGNGSVSSSGVFSPAANSPSPFTVVWARDTTSDRLLYWAFTVIPIPLYSPAQAVALFQK